MEKVFKALADSKRRDLLDRLYRQGGQTLGQLCEGQTMSRQAVSRHLALLEEAGLVVAQWRGREKLHFLNTVPLGEISERWIAKFERPRIDALWALKKGLETPMTDKTFIYALFIEATPETVFKALTSPEFTECYWAGRRIISDWKVGDAVKVVAGEGDAPELTGEVLRHEPPEALSYTWTHAGDPTGAVSTVTFELSEMGGSTKLTVTHEPLPEDDMARQGWVAILSSLKSYLETGAPAKVTALWRR
ncbi:MAG: metalloregulator ArsR/SmtB family transcription factor [Roseovarius sp.]|uniref:ArsR/SmtB family transcription factor n=1 Tax=Roseovarius sp. TaxID=1486281 RepID=UPI0032EC00B0